MNLQVLQTDFQKIILDAECVGAEWVDKSAQDLSPRTRLGIYHNAYRVRLIDVLMDTFEHTAIYLGDDWFHQLASAYVQSHNSTHTNIGLYGKAFPGFLTKELADDLEVSELAQMDWMLRKAFDGRDSKVMTKYDLQQLARGDNINISLSPVPTLITTTHNFNTLDIWHAINTNKQPPDVKQLQESIDVLIWRKDHSPHFRSLTRLEYAALNCVCSECTLDEIGAKLEEDFPDHDIATEFGAMLQRWLNDKIISV